MEKEDWYFVAGVLMWLIDKALHYLERKEQKEETRKNKQKDKEGK